MIPTVIDVAGAVMGGASRYVLELERWMTHGRSDELTVIGHGTRLTSPWLVLREIEAYRANSEHCVAANNFSFLVTGNVRTALLRNALHFPLPGERYGFGCVTRAAIGATRVAVHSSLGRADRIVVPSTAMAERVVAHLPKVATRVDIVHHPLSSPSVTASGPPLAEPVIFCPVLPAPYKRLGQAVRSLHAATGRHPAFDRMRIMLTLSRQEAIIEGLADLPRVELLGRLSPSAIAPVMSGVTAVFFPSEVESFGYPLAEARLARVPVLAPGGTLASEISGDVLVPYADLSTPALLAALDHLASLGQLPPLTANPFDPDRYFRQLLMLPPKQR